MRKEHHNEDRLDHRSGVGDDNGFSRKRPGERLCLRHRLTNRLQRANVNKRMVKRKRKEMTIYRSSYWTPAANISGQSNQSAAQVSLKDAKDDLAQPARATMKWQGSTERLGRIPHPLALKCCSGHPLWKRVVPFNNRVTKVPHKSPWNTPNTIWPSQWEPPWNDREVLKDWDGSLIGIEVLSGPPSLEEGVAIQKVQKHEHAAYWGLNPSWVFIVFS